MKKHGLWRFHYEAACVRSKFPHIKWWEDIKLTNNMISALHSGYSGRWRYSVADGVIECARRYARRYGVELKRACQWDALCERIMSRMDRVYPATRRVCLIGGRPNARIGWHQENKSFRCVKPFAKWTAHDISARAARIEKARASRVARELDSRVALHWEIYQARSALADINRSIKAAQAAMKERFS